MRTSPVATGPGFEDPLARRLQEWIGRAEGLTGEGLPMPVEQVRRLVEHLRAQGEAERAEETLRRAERLIDRVGSDWALLREMLRRLEELKQLAGRAGLSLTELEQRLGNPRDLLKTGRLSEGLLEQAMAVTSKQLAVLNDVLPKYLLTHAQRLGQRIRSAQLRGEIVTEATDRMAEYLRRTKGGQLRAATAAFLELRKAVGQIPREPTVPPMPRDEEEEILREARNLGRRLQRMKSRARDASSAARLSSQVKAALAEDRRYASPEEEIEELWNEVDRLSRERTEARSTEPAPELHVGLPLVPALDSRRIPRELLEAAVAPLDPPTPSPRRRSRSSP